MARSFDGRVALITGASSGIGRALAQALARQGCRVGLVARREAELDSAVRQIREAGGEAEAARADVGDREQLRGAVADLSARLGPADLVVANAGLGVPTALDPMNIEAIEATFRVNLMGVIYTIEATLPAMLAAGRGQVAAISSLAGFLGMPGESAYCASKAAVNAYLDGLRLQLRGRGVGVTTVCPGFVRTPMTEADPYPMPFALDADAAALRILRAICRRAKVARFPWQTDLLIRLAAIAPDWILARAFRDTHDHAASLTPASPSIGGG